MMNYHYAQKSTMKPTRLQCQIQYDLRSFPLNTPRTCCPIMPNPFKPTTNSASGGCCVVWCQHLCLWKGWSVVFRLGLVMLCQSRTLDDSWMPLIDVDAGHVNIWLDGLIYGLMGWYMAWWVDIYILYTFIYQHLPKGAVWTLRDGV